jgi:nicotinate-nucleotide--dimethylbenzimidazole phosphoribosyltransferase
MSTLAATLAAITPQDPAWRAQATARIEQLTMPRWALGRLCDLAVDLAGMTRSLRPAVERATIVTMAGDHGVCAEGVSLFPQAVTPQMVHNFVRGGAGVNVLARVSGARVVVADLGVAADLSALVASGAIIGAKVAPGTANLAVGPAMSRAQALESIERGIAIAHQLAATSDVFGTGEMGIGNTTPAAAIISVLTGTAPEVVTGCGTGIGEAQRQHKAQVIARGLALNRPDPADGLDVLTKVGGFEIGGLAGLCLGAAALRRPVVVDGFISTAGALVAHALCPAVADYLICAHQSEERGHRLMLERLGKRPLLDLGFRLGEGTGAALAMSLVQGARGILTEMATFAEAAVSGAEPVAHT